MTPIEFLRSFRLGDYAIFDFAAAFLGIYLLSPMLTKIFRRLKLHTSRRSWFFLTLPISIIAHLLSGNMTPMTQGFLDPNSHYFLKIFILILLFLGIKDIRIIKAK